MKKCYQYAYVQYGKSDLQRGSANVLEHFFGFNNLTSDAEGGDEMLYVSRKKVQELFNEYESLYEQTKGKCHDKEVALSASHYYGKMCALSDLFGSKCLPDELNEDNFAKSEPKPAEPKFKIGDYVRYKGDVHKVVATTKGNRCYLNKILGSIDESDLEPYTEPTDHIPDPAKMVDDTINNGFRDHNRLHIAAMLAAGMLASEVRCYPIDRALELADKFIAEASHKSHK